MPWCHQATSHYLNQCWHRSMPPYGVTRPQWVNTPQPEQKGCHSADNIFKCTCSTIFFNEKFCIWLRFVQVMAWNQWGSYFMIMPYDVTKPQWVNLLRPELVSNIDGLVQERRNSSALAIELCLSCTNPSIWYEDTHCANEIDSSNIFHQRCCGCCTSCDDTFPFPVHGSLLCSLHKTLTCVLRCLGGILSFSNLRQLASMIITWSIRTFQRTFIDFRSQYFLWSCLFTGHLGQWLELFYVWLFKFFESHREFGFAGDDFLPFNYLSCGSDWLDTSLVGRDWWRFWRLEEKEENSYHKFPNKVPLSNRLGVV